MKERALPIVVIGVILVLAFGVGAATGAKLLTGKDIKNGSVTTKDVKDNNLTGKDIKKGSVKSNDLKDDVGVKSADVKNGTLGMADLSQAVQDAINAASPPTEFAGPGWGIIDRNVIGNGDSYLRVGPSRAGATDPVVPPLGIGSLGMRTGSPDDKASFGNELDFAGMPVADLETLGYSVYTPFVEPGNLPSLQFEIDANLEGVGNDFTTMSFLPDAVLPEVWVDIDPINTGQWFLTGDEGAATGCELGSPPCTWADLQTALDDGGEAALVGSVLFNKGRDFAFSGAVDALLINDTMYDFEPTGVFATTTP